MSSIKDDRNLHAKTVKKGSVKIGEEYVSMLLFYLIKL